MDFIRKLERKLAICTAEVLNLDSPKKNIMPADDPL